MKAQKQTKPATDKLIDELLEQHGRTPEDVKGLLKQLSKAVLERALQGEMTHHLGYGKHDSAGQNSGNSRNGVTRKTLKGDFGEIELATPRDRNRAGGAGRWSRSTRWRFWTRCTLRCATKGVVIGSGKARRNYVERTKCKRIQSNLAHGFEP